MHIFYNKKSSDLFLTVVQQDFMIKFKGYALDHLLLIDANQLNVFLITKVTSKISRAFLKY